MIEDSTNKFLEEKETRFFLLEEYLQAEKKVWIAGVDEVGRGCLAGPVVACAAVFLEKPKSILKEIRDSKKLSEKKREELFMKIIQEKIKLGIGIIDAEVIDEVNILQASLLAMKKAIQNLGVDPDICAVDGNQKIPIAIPQLTVTKGDDRVLSIGAASIIAKVTRDRLMRFYALKYPDYGFERHKGYPTPLHKEVVKRVGRSEIHRKSFAVR